MTELLVAVIGIVLIAAVVIVFARRAIKARKNMGGGASGQTQNPNVKKH